MLDEAVMQLLGEAEPEAAWRRLVKSSDTVGIKSNVWRFLPTPPALEEAIRARVAGVGVDTERIGIDDRGVLGHPAFRQATALINVRPLRTHHWSGVGSCIKNYIMFSRVPSSWHDDSCANLGGLWEGEFESTGFTVSGFFHLVAPWEQGVDEELVDFSIELECTVADEDASWSTVKGLYR